MTELPRTQHAPTFELPPFPSAKLMLERIVQVRGLPERNMEDVVKSLLTVLGHPEWAISFQVGRIDVRVDDGSGKAHMVIEVKRSLLFEKAWNDARRKGFDYAAHVGAPLVVLTDADTYEIYDRTRGLNYESALVRRFQLTRFTIEDCAGLDMLRPACPPLIGRQSTA